MSLDKSSRNPMTLTIRVSIRNFVGGQEVFVLEENLELNTEDFFECSKILGQFHDVTKRVKQEREFKP